VKVDAELIKNIV